MGYSTSPVGSLRSTSAEPSVVGAILHKETRKGSQLNHSHSASSLPERKCGPENPPRTSGILHEHYTGGLDIG